jgi:hypothetical protein
VGLFHSTPTGVGSFLIYLVINEFAINQRNCYTCVKREVKNIVEKKVRNYGETELGYL